MYYNFTFVHPWTMSNNRYEYMYIYKSNDKYSLAYLDILYIQLNHWQSRFECNKNTQKFRRQAVDRQSHLGRLLFHQEQNLQKVAIYIF